MRARWMVPVEAWRERRPSRVWKVLSRQMMLSEQRCLGRTEAEVRERLFLEAEKLVDSLSDEAKARGWFVRK